MPDGKAADFDEMGVATVADDCGVETVPGYTLVEGQPKALVVPGAVMPKPGPKVACYGGPDRAGESVTCPDGISTATFDADGFAQVPDNCGLDEVPGYTFPTGDELKTLRAGAKEAREAAEAAAAAAAPAVSPEPAIAPPAPAPAPETATPTPAVAQEKEAAAAAAEASSRLGKAKR